MEERTFVEACMDDLDEDLSIYAVDRIIALLRIERTSTILSSAHLEPLNDVLGCKRKVSVAVIVFADHATKVSLATKVMEQIIINTDVEGLVLEVVIVVLDNVVHVVAVAERKELEKQVFIAVEQRTEDNELTRIVVISITLTKVQKGFRTRLRTVIDLDSNRL